MKALVVEDEFAITEILKGMLQRNQITSEIAETAKEAYAIIEKEKFDIILCDISLPDGDGFDILARARQVFGDDCYLIAISGYPQNAVDYQVHKLKLDLFLQKPFSEKTLTEALAEIVK